MPKTPLSKRLSNIDLMIGRGIRSTRLSRGMSQEALADKLGISFQQVQKYEKGANRVAASTLREICEVFRCSMSDIMPGTGVSVADPVLPSDEAIKAQAIVEAMPVAARQTALRVLRALEAGRE